jgi:hypothetical protein
MRKTLVIYLFLFTFSLIHSGKSFALMDTAKVTVHVVDELGKPIEGAEVGVGFGVNSQRKEISVKGVTKSDGTFSASELCNGLVGFNVVRRGYYMSIGDYNFSSKGLLKWEPWNPVVTVVLRKIENPVPMFARDTLFSEIEIPVIGKDVGFDLMTFDWVPPYGKGINSDIVFKLSRKFIDWNEQDTKLSVVFPNQFDGIQLVTNKFDSSTFSLPRFAFIEGYKKILILYSKISHSKLVTKHETNIKDTDNYFMRIRSENKNGKFLKGMYGKIAGPIKYSTVSSKTAKIIFKYYINPDYSQNLEFDPNRNLFTGLSGLERVGLK